MDEDEVFERIFAEVRATEMSRQMFDPPYEHIAVAGTPICMIPESEKKYGIFLSGGSGQEG